MNWGLIKRSLAIFIPLALAATTVMYLLHRAEIKNITASAASSEARIVEAGRQRLAITLTSAISDLLYLANQAVLQDWLTMPDIMADSRLTSEYVAFAKHKETYDQIRFIDMQGREGVRVDWKPTGPVVTPPEKLQDKSSRYYVKATLALDKGQIYVSGFDLNVENNVVEEPPKPVIRVATPVFDSTGTKKGMVILNYLGRNLIRRIKALGDAGPSDIWLVNSAGYWLVGPAPDDEWGFMYPDRQDRRFDRKFPDAWNAMKDKTDALQFADAAGLFTVKRVSPGMEVTDDNAVARGEVSIAEAPSWYLISFLPASAIAAQTDVSAHHFLVSYVAILILLMGMSLGIAQLAARLRIKTQVLTETESYFRAAAEGGLNAFLIFVVPQSTSDKAGDNRAGPGRAADPVTGDGLKLDYLNPLAERMLGVTLAEARGRPVEAVMHLLHGDGKSVAQLDGYKPVDGHSPDSADDIRRYHQALADGRLLEWEYTVTSGPFARRYFQEEIVPLPSGIAVSCRDITERRQIEEMKTEFVSTVSHELRTPLTAIRGSLGLVVNGVIGQLPEEVRGLLNIAYNNCERLVRLINDILDIEKIESGRMPFHIRQVTVMPFLRQAIDLNAAFAEKYGVSVVLANPANISEPEKVALLADSDRLLQVMINLLSNATKFSPRGGTVTVSWRISATMVHVAVTDQGSGIPESFRETIFQKFAQADGSDSREKGGTGLGLSIVKAIMEQLSGEVGFDSVVGQGTTFHFSLPLVQQQRSRQLPIRQAPLQNLSVLAQAAVELGDGIGAAVTPPVVIEAQGKRVLICEDEVDIAHLLQMILERAGFAADVTHDAASAMAALRHGTYFALLLDLILPDSCGITVLRDIRADPALAAMPVVVVSAKAEAGRRFLRGDAISLVDWMVKPIDDGRLVQVVQGLFSRSTAARVLHVEDDHDIAEVIRQSLRPWASVISVASLATARQKLIADRYDLVILDIGLPDGSGLDLLPELGAGGGHPTPIVLFTASEVPTEISAQVEAVLIKSKTSEDKFLETIRHLISTAVPEAAVEAIDA